MEQKEFRKLAMTEMDAVYRLAFHLLPGSQDVGDLVQETYLQAFKAAGHFTLTASGLRPWLFKILHNLVRKQFAAQARQPSLIGDRDVHSAAPLFHSDAFADATDIDWENVDERLKLAIAELPAPYRTVFLLCAVEGLKYREIAEVIDLPVGTVMSRLHRARVMLSSQLADLATEQRLVH